MTIATDKRARGRFEPAQVGWRVGRSWEPRGVDLWCPWDRTAGVIGPQGSGKTLDVLAPALIAAPGAALVTLTKVDDLLLTLPQRNSNNRPCVVLDPFGLAPGLPELVWDPIAGCVNRITAERRAKAFTAGTIKAASQSHGGAAHFYAAEAAKVLMSYFHAAALIGATMDNVLDWVANPSAASEPLEVLRSHPSSDPLWHGLLNGALHGDSRTTANTTTTVQQAMSLFFQDDIRRRCVPSAKRPAVDVADIIRRGGTIYMLGREDPYASASPLMTAAAELVLDAGLQLANSGAHGRLCPPMLACLDELPSTAPIPTLRTRMANERALGLSIIWAAQTRRQLDAQYGTDEAKALVALTNVLVMFGGSKDVELNREISELVGTVRIARTSHHIGFKGGGTRSGEDVPILRPEDVRRIPQRQALIVAESGAPIIARLHRCIDGPQGRALLDAQRRLRDQLHSAPPVIDAAARTTAALIEARRHGW